MTLPLALFRVAKRFGGRCAVSDVSFTAARGAITCLLGRNGSGKTTTIRMINGIFSPDAGAIEVFGSRRGAVAERDRIGYLPEERGLYGSMQTLELLYFFAALKGKPKKAVARAAEAWLERFELGHARRLPVAQLSKGNQQKVQLMIALLHDPELVILDEPLSGLDPVNARLVREVIIELKRRGRAILLSTHVMALAQELADEVVLLDRGCVALSGAVEEVRRAHARAAARVISLEFSGDAAFVSALPGVADVRLARGTAGRSAGEVRLAPEADVTTLLAALVGRISIHRFEVMTPSLEAIFIESVGNLPRSQPKELPCNSREP